MKLLAIDTSTEACSVALHDGEKCFHQFEIAPQKHTALIMPMIKSVLKEANCSLNEIDALAFGAGPGSFTGLRIAAGVIQGLAFGNDLSVIPISTLAAMAKGAHRLYSATKTICALDARMEEVYLGVYEIDKNSHLISIIEDQVIRPADVFLPSSFQGMGIGPGWNTYKQTLYERCGKQIASIHSNLYPDAQDIATLAIEKFKKGEFVSAENALPVYLRNPVTQK